MLDSRIVRAWLIVFFLAYAVCGCGQSVDFIETTQNQETNSPLSGISGFLVSNPEVSLVSKLADAPEATPITGGLVLATDTGGRLVGMAVTRQDGGFSLVDVPATAVTLTAFGVPGARADVVAAVSPVPGQIVGPNPVTPIDRMAALNGNARRISSRAISPEALVLGTLNPLPPGTTVEDSSNRDVAYQTKGAEWLFMIDQSPDLKYSHAGISYLLVDSQTGTSTEVQAESYPLVNGQRRWSGDREYLDYEAFSDTFPLPDSFTPKPGPEVLQLPKVDITPRAVGAEEDIRGQLGHGNDGLFFLGVSGDNTYAFELDVVRLASFLELNGVPEVNTRIVLSGDKPSALVEKELRAAIAECHAAVAERRRDGLLSTVVFYFGGHGNATGVFIGGSGFGPGALILGDKGLGLVSNSPACRVRLVLDSCRSGAVADSIYDTLIAEKFLPEVIVYSATNTTRASGFFAKRRPGFEAGSFYNVALRKQARLVDGDLVRLADLTQNPPVMLAPIADVPEIVDQNGVPLRKALPQVRLYPGQPDVCSTPFTAEPIIEDDFPETSKLIFRNETEDEATLELEVGGEKIKVVVPGNNTFEREFPGEADAVIGEFDTPQLKVSDLGAVFRIFRGTVKTLTWAEDSDGGVTLSAKQTLR